MSAEVTEVAATRKDARLSMQFELETIYSHNRSSHESDRGLKVINFELKSRAFKSDFEITASARNVCLRGPMGPLNKGCTVGLIYTLQQNSKTFVYAIYLFSTKNQTHFYLQNDHNWIKQRRGHRHQRRAILCSGQQSSTRLEKTTKTNFLHVYWRNRYLRSNVCSYSMRTKQTRVTLTNCRPGLRRLVDWREKCHKRYK